MTGMAAGRGLNRRGPNRWGLDGWGLDGWGLDGWGAGLALALALAAGTPALSQERAQEGRLVSLLGIRSATVAPGGLGFASAALTSGRRSAGGSRDDLDASLVLGLGFGSAVDSVGVQLTANVTSLKDEFGDSGSLGVKLAREVGPEGLPVYLGLSVDRVGPWGGARTVDESVSAMVTAFPRAEVGGGSYPLMLTAGAGTNLRDDFSEDGVFAGAGIGLSPTLGASLAWTGESVSVGAAFRVPGLDRVTFTASVDDAFDQADARRLTLTATFYARDLFGG